MRFTGNFFSEGAHARGGSFNPILLVPLVACAVGAAASGAVILSLVDSPMTQPGVSSISLRAIVRNVGASEPTKTAQDRPIIETSLRPAVTGAVSGRDELVAPTEAEPAGQQSRKHSQQRSRERHGQGRFAHAFWSSPRFSSRRDELTSGVR